MNLEALLKRADEIEAAIVNMSNQYQALLGHKAEVAYWIEQLRAEKPLVADEVELPVE